MGEVIPAEAGSAPLTRPWHQRAENMFLALVLGAMVLLPLFEAVLRKFFQAGISNQPAILQHLTLVAGMAGAAIAARERRLLSLGSLELILPETWRRIARMLGGSFGAAIAVYLCIAATTFVLSERTTGSVLAYGVPVWLAQAALPIGFALIAWRIVRGADTGARWRMGTAALAIVIAALPILTPAQPERLVVPAFVLLIGATVLGTPIFAALGGAGLILFWSQGSPISSVTVDHYSLATNPTLPAIPLFTLAGYFLAEGGASRRLIRLFKALVGPMRGGPAILVALVCAFFTSFTGGSGVTILALGGLLMPVLLSAGYSDKNALGLLTGAGSLGLLFPPCLTLIFYAVIAGVDIRDMFLAGIVPGMLLVALTAAWGISQAPRLVGERQRYDMREIGAALWTARWELLVPVVALGALFSGLATPVEAAAATAFYAFLVESVLHRDLRPLHDAPRVMAESGVLVGGVLLILGVALGFTNYLAFAEIPAKAVDWVTATVQSKWMFLLLLNIMLLFVGMVMDIFSATVIVVPLMVPLGRAFGIDPVHLGIIFLANLELGYLTPPVGQNLFLASLRFGQPVSKVFRAVIPMMIVFLVGVVLITYLPWLSTWLPGLFRG